VPHAGFQPRESAATLAPVQIAERSRRLDERVQIEMRGNDVGPLVQERVQFLVGLDVEQRYGAPPGARMNETAFLRLEVPIDPRPELLAAPRDRRGPLGPRRADNQEKQTFLQSETRLGYIALHVSRVTRHVCHFFAR
jgi:hypothetical protein